MNRHTIRCATGTSMIALLASGMTAASDPQELRHNPFSRPPSERTITEPSVDGNTNAVAPAIDLRATMVAAKDRLANIGGRILRPGDDVQGYSLRQVFEDRAVFVREGKELTIYVKPDRMEDDEDRRR